MKLRFRSEKAETAWIAAVQIYFAGLILLVLAPLICLLMPTGSVGEFEMKLGLLIGYAAVGLALPVYLSAGVIVRCAVSILTSKNLTAEDALPEKGAPDPWGYRNCLRGGTAGAGVRALPDRAL